MEIIITDLTRFHGNKVCIAGINPETYECIRPMPYIPVSTCKEKNILPGSRLKGNFIPLPNLKAPHTEDKKHNNLKLFSPCTSEEFYNLLSRTEEESIADGFEIELKTGQKHIPIETPPDHSIITIQVDPKSVSFVENQFKPGEVKMHFTDRSGLRFQYMPINDFGYYNYMQSNGTGSFIFEINPFIQKQNEVFFRIGLTREHPIKDKKGFWIQVNGIYTFPDCNDDIRCYNR
ncbi:MAG: hypothetical protein HOG03_18020 [Desulfobacula sp.]|jgi:hypothetical protein|uniref:hypothetical protein n=1 Tax=Desulfobacula sp. TaxID=2593537 RepID=UPI001D999421|nr:hypothetical protein [Desulfobacula sp.]MBT3486801.1 hypothetical protein [Desulfobacula sp.]MBT3806474.1 hypothetical protein [Desulfobacula sp.]MBT4026417.1 hypothetical protein [Desulfobacula sp.]MBT4201124.1 hypothetical protein [Desulfobacula sp.]